MGTRSARFGTIGDFVAIILWSTTVALARSLSEQLDPMTAAAAVYSVSGAIALAQLLRSREKRQQISQVPRKYLIGCGVPFLSYMIALFLAIGHATDHQQVLEVGLVNYLWPTLTILLSLLILKRRAKLWLIPGTLLALVGIFLVLTQGTYVSWQSILGNLSANPVTYALGLIAAVSWAVYSNLTRRWAEDKRQGMVDLFLPITAVILIVIALLTESTHTWNVRVLLEVGFLGTVTYVAYWSWGTSMHTGNSVLVTAASYLTPFFSTVVTSLYLRVTPTVNLWIGCDVLILGSLISWLSIATSTGATALDSVSER
ncbi:MAG: aromatic amino acid DMT transporter YddG [Candidatus Bipolaricaulota bacterium]|nr:aromatic amino acid DMT transporter YddG [Candidatus Bipolaricaulota bacterium]